jgi:outer membrane receptor for ferrienterochelin and colicin
MIFNVSNYYFFDYNAKVNHRFNANNRLFFNLYQSKDNFKNKNSDYGLKENISWENSVASLRWNHVYPNSLFSNLTLYHSKYKYVSGDVMNTDQITYSTGIHDFSAKNDYNYNILNHSLRFGAQYLFQVVKPAVTVINQSATHTHLQKDTTYKSTFNPNQVTIYIEDEIQLIEKLTATAGFHLAGYASDRVFYPSLQPRVSANYNLVPSVSLKASYTRMSQPLHLLSNTWSGDPSDLWVPSTKRVKPENANQVAAGISYNYKSLFFSAEAWWKNMHNLVDYAQGASYANKNANWQDQITTGSGIAKGIELSIKREKGRATGLISYSFSKSERTFAKINNGKPFPYTYDRAHSITSALMLKLNDKYSLGANWVFASGQPVTITESIVINQLMWGDEWYYKYSSINGVRLPNYHRLDISLNYTKKYNIFDFQASTGVYNAYNRKNPYSVYDDSETLYINSLLGIVPYVTLTFSFNS